MYGEYEHTVDAKGRMNFPAKLREEFGEHFYICKSFNAKCLTVYTTESWEELKTSLKGKPSKAALPIERFLFGSACEAEPDKQGRIAIAPALRAYANITGEVVVVGLVDRAEIWDKASWEEYTNSTPMEDIADMAEELGI
ncbi:MAG: division/cell wall cluster transcriptional repressor MraZ [Oscillospiraceae bacterium]|nr:division/cell wall cluster transcriptional repressor MraZ [Oscillospiraceae bacterium]